MMTPRDRYATDPNFAALVDVMHGFIARSEFTPSELREAAILAAVKYEMGRGAPARIVLAEAVLDELSADPGPARKRAR